MNYYAIDDHFRREIYLIETEEHILGVKLTLREYENLRDYLKYASEYNTPLERAELRELVECTKGTGYAYWSPGYDTVTKRLTEINK